MPGLLRPDATCPMCRDPLDALVDTSFAGALRTLKREYYHGKPDPHHRRRVKCTWRFVGDIEVARAEKERTELEVPRR